MKCEGQIISDIQVQTRPPYYPRHGKWWESPIGILSSIHTNTKPDIVRRFLIVEPGQPCDDRRRSESERLLRAQPFIASASVKCVRRRERRRDHRRANDGRADDDRRRAALRPRVRTSRPSRSARATSGAMRSTSRAHWAHGKYRDYFGANYTDYQFLGRPWHLDLQATARRCGDQQLARRRGASLLTDEQRFAWRAVALDHQDLYSFRRSNDTSRGDRLLAQVRRRRRRRASRAAGSAQPLRHERLERGRHPGASARADARRAVRHAHAILGRHKNARLNLLWGIRSIDFVRVERFDALTAAQDVQAGFQLGTLLGRSLQVLGSTDDDIFLASKLYAGAGNKRTFAFCSRPWKGETTTPSDKWDGIVGSAHISMYQRLDGISHARRQRGLGRHLESARARAAAAGRARGRRARLSLVARRRQHPLREPGSRIGGISARCATRPTSGWRCSATPGECGRATRRSATAYTTPLKFGAGLGVLVAMPPGSKVTYRLDIARALSPDLRARWEFRVSFMNAARLLIP